MTDNKLSEAASLLLDFLSLIRNDLFFENFPLRIRDFPKCITPTTLPPSHIKVILYLEREKSVPISQVAKKLGISKSNMTPIIDKLIELELVNRYSDSKDRRILRVELTPKAMELFEYLESIAKKTIKNKISALSDNDLEDLSNSLCTLSSIMRKIQ
ncbi:MarR family winged helix-turn-helix transcriptional regulator [uncultured Clostridium sp.]|uniref:MarR family winged helix-turn-helix transcriptional regulator n=1 Tax=uncultured Clostridium sp. TaxID=59620 RepID=UPI0025E2BA11|nr:MarR family transcriptional regulator [uncultured Clostridium sp.]